MIDKIIDNEKLMEQIDKYSFEINHVLRDSIAFSNKNEISPLKTMVYCLTIVIKNLEKNCFENGINFTFEDILNEIIDIDEKMEEKFCIETKD